MRQYLVAFLAAGLAAAAALIAADAADTKTDPRVELAKKLPGEVKPEEISPSGIPGLYVLQRGMQIFYASADGRYLINGELHDLKTKTNLTEARRSDARRKLLASVPEKDLLVFGPDLATYTITVFTDVDCVYCQRLHADIAQLNNLGIRVRYLFYPRAGPGSDSWRKAENVWCASDRREAFKRAVSHQPVPPAKCDASIVGKHFELGNEMGVEGTPGIFTSKGTLLRGYLPPQQMLASVQQDAGAAAK